MIKTSYLILAILVLFWTSTSTDYAYGQGGSRGGGGGSRGGGYHGGGHYSAGGGSQGVGAGSRGSGASYYGGSHYSGGGGSRGGGAAGSAVGAGAGGAGSAGASYYGGSHYSGGGGSRGARGWLSGCRCGLSRRQPQLLWRRSLFWQWRLSQWRWWLLSGKSLLWRGRLLSGRSLLSRKTLLLGRLLAWGCLDRPWMGLGWMVGSVVGCPVLSVLSYYASPPVVVEQQPPTYVEPEQPQESYWYYCENPKGYYPYVQNCPGGWMKVAPQPAPPK